MRLKGLCRRFDNDIKFRQDHFSFMRNLISNGHAEKVPEFDENAFTTMCGIYPIMGCITHKNLTKFVWSLIAVRAGESLNSQLLQGPDLTNKLLGVICRFRQEPVAVMCDIEQMFYQFRVSKDHLDNLRWDTDDYTMNPVEFRMTVHLIGATSSPGYATDNEAEFRPELADF